MEIEVKTLKQELEKNKAQLSSVMKSTNVLFALLRKSKGNIGNEKSKFVSEARYTSFRTSTNVGISVAESKDTNNANSGALIVEREISSNLRVDSAKNANAAVVDEWVEL